MHVYCLWLQKAVMPAYELIYSSVLCFLRVASVAADR